MPNHHPSTFADIKLELPNRLPATQLVAADLPEREPILDPILTTKSLALLYGPRGLGKTFVALGIAWAAAAGESFLGWQASRPHRVLYIDGEMAAVDLKQRMLQFPSLPPTLEFMILDLHHGMSPDLGYVDGQLKLMQEWGDPELVVFDNLSSLAGFGRGDPDCWNDLQRFLLVQRQNNRAMLLVHHANKKGFQRGTNRREDVLDLVMALKRPADYEPRQGARFEIHFEKARGLFGEAVEPIEARLETDPYGDARWTWRPTHVGDVERVAELLQRGLNPNQVARELGMSKSQSYRLRERAVEMGLVDAAKAPPAR